MPILLEMVDEMGKRISKINRYDILLPRDPQQEFQVFLEAGALLTFHCSSQAKGGVLLLPLESLQLNILRDALIKIESALGVTLRDMQFKLVAYSDAIKLMDPICLGLAIEPQSRRILPSGKAELIFYPHENRLRLLVPDHPSAAADPASAHSPEKVTKVLIVDDSPTIRKLLRKILSDDPAIEVVGETGLPSEVPRLLQDTHPDVMTLDIHMPEMDGVTLLKKLTISELIQTIMISSISMEEGPMVLEAL